MQRLAGREAGLAERIAAVRHRVTAAAERVGRRPDEVTIIAVTKTVPLDVIKSAFALHLDNFGENRVQEAERKIAAWPKAPASEGRPRWHLIGHLQTNKVKTAVQLFDVIHSVDSVRLARAISVQAVAIDKVMPVLIEVNLSGESTKFGFAPEEVSGALAEIAELPGLGVMGLMTIAAPVENPEEARPTFRQLRELRDELRARYPALPLRDLSMGMTNDFEVAIEEGATYVRIGRAIFGERPPIA